MLPILQVLAERGELHRRDYSRLAGERMGLSEQAMRAMLPSGNESYLYNRSGWAGWYMQQAGLCRKRRRGFLEITEEGRELLAQAPARIDNKLLKRYPAFVERVVKGKGRKAQRAAPDDASSGEAAEHEQTPDDRIEQAHEELQSSLATDLLDQMAGMDPFRFEQLVIDLLFAMGYGGSREDAAKVTQKSNDGGIDGVINEDRLGLDVIYVQAKRWQNTIGRKEIQSFVGALAGKQANKGVFITTSDFASTATDYAEAVTQKVILIDGARLADLMIEHDIGVSTVRTIAIKRIDSDYFEEA